MFTGLIEELGSVKKMVRGNLTSKLEISARLVVSDVKIGDSIAVNGVCLTVISFDAGTMVADVMNETLSRSSLGKLKSGDVVNLERAMKADGRFGGHMVSGHIDGTGEITMIKKDGIAMIFTIKASEGILKYVVEKGSIAIDGISLTVMGVDQGTFKVSIIPHTIAQTTLNHKRMGDVVNLEVDMVGKYIEKFLKGNHKGGISQAFLTANGF